MMGFDIGAGCRVRHGTVTLPSIAVLAGLSEVCVVDWIVDTLYHCLPFAPGQMFQGSGGCISVEQVVSCVRSIVRELSEDQKYSKKCINLKNKVNYTYCG